MSGRTIIVGDIHGMLEEFKRLMEAVGLSLADRLVLVGDLLDKGPDSCGVVTFARSLREQGVDLVLVKGNHEEKHERFRAAYAKAGDKVKMKGFDELKAITEGLSSQDVAFLNTAVIYHAMPEHNALAVHAGILPDTDSLPSMEEYTAMSKGEQSKFDRVLRVRYVTGQVQAKITLEFVLDGVSAEDIAAMSPAVLADLALAAEVVRQQVRPKGSFISLGQEKDGDPLWAEVYDGRFGHVFFGHNPYPDADKPVEFPHATALDMGAVFGGHLAAAVLEEGKPVEYVQVKASGKFSVAFGED